MYISSLTDTSNLNYSPKYLFIRCVEDDEKGVQVLNLPPARLQPRLALPLPRLHARHTQLPPATSINVIILDDVSRAEVYRLYPETVDKLTSINKDSDLTTEVLDFLSVQSLGEEGQFNLEALLGGYVNIHHDEEHSVDEDTRFIFNSLVSKGYRSNIYESTCEDEDNIIPQILRLNSDGYRQYDIKERLKMVGLETATSLNPAILPNCCLHIKLLDAMIERYLMDISNFEMNRFPYFSTLILKTSCLHRQKLDTVLSRLVEESSQNKNSLTIITSTKSGSMDSSLPLFLLCPARAKQKLSDSRWHSVVMNQDRLISLLDIHHFLRLHLLPDSSLKSKLPELQAFRNKFFGSNSNLGFSISTSRSCDELPRLEFGCICQAHTSPIKINRKIKLLGVFGCEHLEAGSLCGCSALSVVAASKQDIQEESSSQLQHLATIELDNGSGLRSIVTYSVNMLNNAIKIQSEGSNLNCGGENSKHDDILDQIDQNFQDPAIKKKIEGVYQENGFHCCYLVTQEAPGVAVIRMVNTCNNQIIAKLDFQTDSAYFLHTGDVKYEVGPGRVETVNVFISPHNKQDTAPDWTYSIIHLESN